MVGPINLQIAWFSLHIELQIVKYKTREIWKYNVKTECYRYHNRSAMLSTEWRSRALSVQVRSVGEQNIRAGASDLDCSI